jgi:serine/threonine-protein kinase
VQTPPGTDQIDDQAPLVTRVDRPPTPGPRATGTAPSLPDDLLRDAAKRLRLVALIYAGGVVVAELSVALLDQVQREQYAHFYGWGPGTISVIIAFAVAVLAGSRRVPLQTIMNIGVVFEIVAAYSIAISTYWGVYRGLAYEPEHLTIIGLSFVAPWIMFYTIVIPNPPRKALLAATLAATSVPVALLLSARYGGSTIRLDPGGWVTVVVVPYALIVLTAWIGARVVFKLGTAVRKARELGSYRLVERLGRGGMGEVWRAKHRMLARPAAIKLVRPDVLGVLGTVDDEERRQVLGRFEREAQTTAMMRSPHTIELYDFGVTDDGTFYYVMELLDGFDLETLVNQFGPLPPERVIHLLCQACDSLAEAHSSSLIHRDIKPANIYVCRYGRRTDFVKLLDFGLVKLWQEEVSGEVDVTAEHGPGGTPAYMAPEQAAGDGHVDGRADIYALGCVAYWLVTGQLVFEASGGLQMIARHLRTIPTPPSERTELDVPRDLDEVILACLEKDPNRRPQTADELAQRLVACETATRWTPERAQEWWDKHQPAVSRISDAERRFVPAPAPDTRNPD